MGGEVRSWGTIHVNVYFEAGDPDLSVTDETFESIEEDTES